MTYAVVDAVLQAPGFIPPFRRSLFLPPLPLGGAGSALVAARKVPLATLVRVRVTVRAS